MRGDERAESDGPGASGPSGPSGEAAGERPLGAILRGVSRSFWLTLRVAPRRVRSQLGVGYLFCRAADTIADTRVLPPPERLRALEEFRGLFEADAPASRETLARIAASIGERVEDTDERRLLERLPDVFSIHEAFAPRDRELLRRLVMTLTIGMRIDLETFPAEDEGAVRALDSDASLDRYCYHVAGCVGEFWTDLHLEHLRALGRWDPVSQRERGVRFGKGLQLTNILRDVDGDLAIGRSYLPAPRLAAVGVTAEELAAAADRSVARPVVHDLLRVTLAHYDAGWEYASAIPRRLPAMRLACVWPLWIGLRTLALLAEAEDPCARGVVRKITRAEVKRLMRESVARLLSRRRLDARYAELRAEVVERLEGGRPASR